MTDNWREGVDRELRHLSEKIDLRLAALEKALVLQAAEYERRMGVLNHEGARLKEAAALSVSHEKYESNRAGDQRELAALREKMANDQKQIMEHIHTQAGMAIVKARMWSGVAIAVGIVSALASWFAG